MIEFEGLLCYDIATSLISQDPCHVPRSLSNAASYRYLTHHMESFLTMTDIKASRIRSKRSFVRPA
jgi:hypothetical protein